MTNKNATTTHEIHPILEERWSPRAFTGEPVPRESLLQCFEAARWAPSSMNDQPWHFLYVQREDEEAFQKAIDCLTPFNQDWAHGAGTLVFILVRERFTYNDKPNAHAQYDTGQAVSQLTMQAWHLGFVAHQMGGFKAEKVANAFSLPPGHRPLVVMALGRLGSPDSLSESLRESEVAPRTRRALEECLSDGMTCLKNN